MRHNKESTANRRVTLITICNTLVQICPKSVEKSAVKPGAGSQHPLPGCKARRCGVKCSPLSPVTLNTTFTTDRFQSSDRTLGRDEG